MIQKKTFLFVLVIITVTVGVVAGEIYITQKRAVPAEKSNNMGIYEVDIQLARKAASKYFQIQRDMFEGWRNSQILLNKPKLCRDPKGLVAAYLFDVAEDIQIKGMVAISATKKFRPFLFSSTESLEQIENKFRHALDLKYNEKIEFICFEGSASLILKVARGTTDAYYLSTLPYTKLDKNVLINEQTKTAPLDPDFINESIDIWNRLEHSNE